MKILFAVSNENIAEAIKREYQKNYKAQLLTKNVYYFNAIIKELQNNKTYDVVIINEELEPFANNNYDTIDKFLVDKLLTIREEAINEQGNPVPIIFITADKHILGDFLTVKLYEIGIYNALVGNDRSIENVCTLMFHPRNKQEAKNYYRVNSEIDNGPKEDDVKEEEVKNIIAHYKSLGKAEEKYVESFNNIVSQYNDAQLKVIIRCLPLNVKAVLEAQSLKYQSLTTFANNYNNGSMPSTSQVVKTENLKQKKVNVDTSNNRVLEQISSVKNTSEVIIPNAMNINKVRKISNEDSDIEDNKDNNFNNIKNNMKDDSLLITDRRKSDKKASYESIKHDVFMNAEPTNLESNVLPGFEDDNSINDESNVLPGFEDDNSINDESNVLPGFEDDNSINGESNVLPGFEDKNSEINTAIESPVKKGRGRPKKPIDPTLIVSNAPKKGRGRPKKNVEPLQEVYPNDIEEVQEETILPGFDNSVTENTTDNNFVSEQTNEISETLTVNDEINYQNKIQNDNSYENNEISDFENHSENNFVNPIGNIQKTNTLTEKPSVRYENIEYLIPSDKRVASFIGTSKSGVSFIVNNLAQILSTVNINVAILDVTTNKNSFYIYTNNDDSLRNKATNSIYNLIDGKIEGIKVNKNLTVYTGLPTDTEKFYEADKVLKTLIDNYSVVLIDCDYETPIGYFDNSTDVFLVQNMDILTMQPLTTFLKELKSKGILKDEKLRTIINMETKVKSITPQILLNAISVYKDPGMAFTIDLFNRATVKLFSVPFDIEAYNKYLTTLVDCNLTLNGYPKAILTALKEIGTCIYPLLSTGNGKKTNSYTPPSLNNYTSTPFGGNMGDTLNKMKGKY